MQAAILALFLASAHVSQLRYDIIHIAVQHFPFSYLAVCMTIPVDALEIIASLTGLTNLWLVTRGRPLNWLFGIITVSLYFIIFMRVQLYAGMMLQLVFLTLQCYGLHQWRQAAKKNQHILIVQIIPKKEAFCLFSFGFFSYVVISFLLYRYTQARLIWIDALVATLSLLAQWAMARRYLEHWWLWMVIDLLSIGLYLEKSLYFSSGLYAIYFIFCIQGYYSWKAYQRHAPVV